VRFAVCARPPWRRTPPSSSLAKHHLDGSRIAIHAPGTTSRPPDAYRTADSDPAARRWHSALV
jgi:hypothetical protein